MEMLGPLKKLFRKVPQEGIGLCVGGDSIFVAHLVRHGEEWWLDDLETWNPPREEEDVGEPQAVAEQVRMHCARNGWSMDDLTLCFIGDNLFTETTQLPEMEQVELEDTIHWEVEEKEFFGDEEFHTLHVKIEGKEGNFWLAAMGERNLKAWELPWEGMCAPLLSAMPPLENTLHIEEGRISFAGKKLVPGKGIPRGEMDPGSLPAVYGAMLAVGLLPPEKALRFPTRSLPDGWNWKRLSLAAACCSLLVMGVISGYDLWNLYEAGQAKEALQQERLLLAREEKTKNLLEQSIRETELRDKRLEALSRESFPWYSLLVHFGSMTVEGVYIKDISLSERDTLQVEGEAVTFDALADFLKGFESDKNFFPQGPILQNSSVPERGTAGASVHFSLQLHI